MISMNSVYSRMTQRVFDCRHTQRKRMHAKCRMIVLSLLLLFLLRLLVRRKQTTKTITEVNTIVGPCVPPRDPIGPCLPALAPRL